MSKQTEHITIENAINDLLDGENKNNALDWVAFLNANNFMAVWNPENKQLRINYKDVLVSCSYVDVAGADFIINFCTLDFNDSSSANGDLKEFTWKHTVVCPQGCGEQTICEISQKQIKIFGKEYDNICISPLQIINPDRNDFKYAKKLMQIIKQKMDSESI